MNWTAYRMVSALLDPVVPAAARLLLAGRSEEREERLGRYRAEGGPSPVWLHAASAGETEGAEPIVREIRRAVDHASIVLTSMTRAGRRRAAAIPGIRPRFAPIDVPSAVRSAFALLRPRAILLVETEIWPNLLAEAARTGVPVAVVNGRISARAFGRMRFAAPLYRAALGRIALFGVQRDIDGERFAAFGAPPGRIFVHGNTKVDSGGAEPPDPGIRSGPAERWVVFGSVRPGEEEAVLRAARAVLASGPDRGIVVAPRHPDRAGAYLAASDIPWIRWSEARNRRAEGKPRAILVDTIGDLLSFYRTADVAFVGGSISRHGGHNPIEPARFRVPVVMGPHRENCREFADRLAEAGALQTVATGEALGAAVLALLGDDDERLRRGEAALAALRPHAGAAARCVRRLVEEGILRELDV